MMREFLCLFETLEYLWSVSYHFVQSLIDIWCTMLYPKYATSVFAKNELLVLTLRFTSAFRVNSYVFSTLWSICDLFPILSFKVSLTFDVPCYILSILNQVLQRTTYWRWLWGIRSLDAWILTSSWHNEVSVFCFL